MNKIKKKRKLAVRANRGLVVDQRKESILQLAKDLSSSDEVLKKFEKNIKKKVVSKKHNKYEEYQEELKEELLRVLTVVGSDSHYNLANTTDQAFGALAVDFCKQVIQEYKCETSSEKALAELLASSYIRYLKVANRLDTSISGDYLSKERNAFMTILSKELDRAFRTYLTALTTLKQLKNYPVRLNIKATTAFVAQNQQVNAMSKKVEANEKINT
jgi:hypothetical protein